jgi:uncharacterized protein (DUF433 family)
VFLPHLTGVVPANAGIHNQKGVVWGQLVVIGTRIATYR